MTRAELDLMSPKTASVCLGLDAFRFCLGGKGDTFTLTEVIAYLKCLQAVEARRK